MGKIDITKNYDIVDAMKQVFTSFVFSYYPVRGQ